MDMARTSRPRFAPLAVCALWTLVAALGFARAASAQEPPAPPQPEQAPATPPPAPGGGPGGPGAAPPIRPYDRVITKEAKSDDGVFTVHRIGERIYYEIPAAQLNKEFLWV